MKNKWARADLLFLVSYDENYDWLMTFSGLLIGEVPSTQVPAVNERNSHYSSYYYRTMRLQAWTLAACLVPQVLADAPMLRRKSFRPDPSATYDEEIQFFFNEGGEKELMTNLVLSDWSEYDEL